MSAAAKRPYEAKCKHIKKVEYERKLAAWKDAKGAGAHTVDDQDEGRDEQTEKRTYKAAAACTWFLERASGAAPESGAGFRVDGQRIAVFVDLSPQGPGQRWV